LVEFALILPVILILLFGALEFGRIFHAYLVITSSAREAARVVVVTADLPSTTSTNETVVAAELAIKNSSVSLNPKFIVPASVSDIQDKNKYPPDDTIWYAIVYNDPTGGARTFGNPVGVYVKGKVDLVVPIISSIIGNPKPVPLHGAKAVMRIEKM
jgi:hypothetical protein